MKRKMKLRAYGRFPIVLSCAFLLIGCGSNVVKDPYPYSFTNKDHPKAETDADMTIDGKFEEIRWNNSRWLTAVDRMNSKQYAEIEFTTSYGDKGVYFAMKVEETGTNIYVNPDRPSWMNSCIEMYMGPASDGADSPRCFEFDFIADGSYDSELNYNGWSSAKTTYDKMPIIASQTLGGGVNEPECYGYTVEAFFPWSFLEFADYDLTDKENLILGIDPAHIFSFNYNGTDQNGDRYWSHWSEKYINVGWQNPSTFFKFGKNGLIAYEYTVKYTGSGRGTVTEKNGWDFVLAEGTSTFTVSTVNGAPIKKLTVNKEDYLDKLTVSSGIYTFTVTNPTGPLDIEIEIG